MAKKDPAASKAKPEKKEGRLRLIARNYRMAKELDPAITWWMLGAFLLVGALFFVVGFFALREFWWMALILGLLGGILAALIVMARRSQRAALDSIDGQPGAPARVLTMLKRGWKVDEIVAFTKQQDMVHRVVGPPGIVLVGEGNGSRLRGLMVSERRKHERVASETTIHEVVVGRGEGQVPLDKLVKHLTKMKRTLKPADMTDVLNRIKALDAQRSRIPIPKGPVPTSMKGMRGNMRGR